MISSTGPKTQEKITFIVYYQGFLAVSAILLFSTKLDIYLQKQGIGMPLYWMIAFILASVPLFGTIFKRLQYVSHSVLVWCGVYLALPLISILISPNVPEQQLLENHYRTIIFFLLMLVIFSQHACILMWARKAIFGITVANVLMFIYEFFNPTAFYLEQDATGRSSGFYHDANTASSAIIAGMILTIDFVKPKYRIIYVLFICLGVAPTFSRGGFASLGLIILLFILTKVIPRYQVPLVFLSGLITVFILSNQVNNLTYLKTADGTDLFTKGTISRVEFLLDPLGHEESKSDGRLSHVDEAWKKFARSPFLGNGLGSGTTANYTSTEGNAQRSHNIYLDLMVEYGFLGALMFPWLLLACVWKVEGELLKKQAIAFVVFFLIWGFFSHTIIKAFDYLVFYALVANLAQQSSLERPPINC